MFLALGTMTNQLLRGKGLSTRLDLVEPCSGVAAPGEIVRQHMKHPMKISLEAGSVAKCSTRLSNIGASHLPIAHTVTHGDHPVRPLLLRKTRLRFSPQSVRAGGGFSTPRSANQTIIYEL